MGGKEREGEKREKVEGNGEEMRGREKKEKANLFPLKFRSGYANVTV